MEEDRTKVLILKQSYLVLDPAENNTNESTYDIEHFLLQSNGASKIVSELDLRWYPNVKVVSKPEYEYMEPIGKYPYRRCIVCYYLQFDNEHDALQFKIRGYTHG
jgi:hypothetical protein